MLNCFWGLFMKIFIGDNYSCALDYDYYATVIYLMDIGEIVSDPKEADVIIFAATCCGSYDNINYIVEYILDVLSQKREDATTFVTGCITRDFYNSKLDDKIKNFLKSNFDYIIPDHRIDMLMDILARQKLTNKFGACLQIDETEVDMFISNGCTNKCTFCRTTFQKMSLKSMPFDMFTQGISDLPDKVKTVNLIATNLSQYLDGKHTLIDIIEFLEGVEQIETVNYNGFAYADAIKRSFAPVLRKSAKANLIDSSLESGSPRILSMMDKGYTIEQFLDFNRVIQELYPKKLNLNIIAGFPTETLADIRMTLDVIKEIAPNAIYLNKYVDSPFVKSHVFEQLSEAEIDEHYDIYKRELKKMDLQLF